jgi:hypothetical protein
MDLSKEDSPFKNGERIHLEGELPFDKGELKKGKSPLLRVNEKRFKSGFKNVS